MSFLCFRVVDVFVGQTYQRRRRAAISKPTSSAAGFESPSSESAAATIPRQLQPTEKLSISLHSSESCVDLSRSHRQKSELFYHQYHQILARTFQICQAAIIKISMKKVGPNSCLACSIILYMLTSCGQWTCKYCELCLLN